MQETLLQPTKKRLEELEKEIQELKLRESSLLTHWKKEKEFLEKIRHEKEYIEHLKQQAADAERIGDLGKVAELRYGTIIDSQKQLDILNKSLSEFQLSQKMLKEEVDAEDIAEIVAKWTGIPVQKMLETERTKLLQMEQRLSERVVGQPDAVKVISNAIRRSRAGLQDANKPIGSFIFLGTTGVGKTEMAKALAEYLFDDESAIVRIDMSEYMEKHSVSRLVGAPPGYVGYDEGGQLTEQVRNHPYSVVLFDEIEKAHADVFNILLQVLDDGRLTDSKGRVVNFTNTVVIMTSNLGTEFLQDKLQNINESNRNSILNEARIHIIELLKQKMRPEFLNRIDEIILFKPLIQSEIRSIVSIQIAKLTTKLKNENINIQYTEELLDWIGNLGFDPQYGARPLKRAIQKYLVDPLAVKILSTEISSGDSITATVNEVGGIEFIKN